MIKFLKGALLAALLVVSPALAVTGCSTIAAVTGQSSVATFDEKALLTVEIAYGGVLDAVIAADEKGMITPQRAAQIIPLLKTAQETITKARQAYDLGNAVDALKNTEDATAQVGALVQLLIAAGIITRA